MGAFLSLFSGEFFSRFVLFGALLQVVFLLFKGEF
jgi:hypothetical protein